MEAPATQCDGPSARSRPLRPLSIPWLHVRRPGRGVHAQTRLLIPAALRLSMDGAAACLSAASTTLAAAGAPAGLRGSGDPGAQEVCQVNRGPGLPLSPAS